MAFVQIIDFRTSKYDELMALDAEWRKATEGKRTLRRSMVARDRNDPERYVVLAFFDDYESAMANSALPETGEFATKQQALASGPATFIDLDVLDDSD
jgi:quinol monooxygenase YgiN